MRTVEVPIRTPQSEADAFHQALLALPRIAAALEEISSKIETKLTPEEIEALFPNTQEKDP